MEIDFYGKRLNLYKCALHTHSTVSDGDYSPDEIIRLYKDAGYDVLCFSDHHLTNPVSSYDGQGMTLLSGMEIHPVGPRNVIWHLLAIGVPEDLAGQYPSGQAAIDAATAAGALVFCAHPSSAFSSHDILQLRGLTGIEVSNTNGRFTGRESSEECWNELIAEGWRCSALAVDDAHTACDLFKNWTMVAAEDKKPETILVALKEGRFFSTQGPCFSRLKWENGCFEADFSEAVEAFVYGYPGMEIIGTPGFPTPDTAPLMTSLKCTPNGSFRGVFRCRIRDAQNRCAWTMPICF